MTNSPSSSAHAHHAAHAALVGHHAALDAGGSIAAALQNLVADPFSASTLTPRLRRRQHHRRHRTAVSRSRSHGLLAGPPSPAHTGRRARRAPHR